MIVRVNGEDRQVRSGATVAELLELVGASPGGRGVAVALGGEVVPRGRWSETVLPAGTSVEIVAAVQGG